MEWRDRLCIWIAWMLPRRLVKWCAARLMAHATYGPYEDQVVSELTALDALGRWPD